MAGCVNGRVRRPRRPEVRAMAAARGFWPHRCGRLECNHDYHQDLGEGQAQYSSSLCPSLELGCS